MSRVSRKLVLCICSVEKLELSPWPCTSDASELQVKFSTSSKMISQGPLLQLEITYLATISIS